MSDVGMKADSLYFAAQPALALALCEETFASGQDDAGLRWRAARAGIAIGMLQREVAKRLVVYDQALLHARQATALAPNDLEARYWVAAAAGRRAYRNDPVYSAKLGREVFEHVSAILAADSVHAGAHHALGMLHGEVLRVSPFARFVASRVLRIDLARRANWNDAELHMRRAVELEPEMIQYLVDLADLYHRMGRPRDASAIVDRLAVTPSRHPMDDSLRSRLVTKWKLASAGAP